MRLGMEASTDQNRVVQQNYLQKLDLGLFPKKQPRIASFLFTAAQHSR